MSAEVLTLNSWNCALDTEPHRQSLPVHLEPTYSWWYFCLECLECEPLGGCVFVCLNFSAARERARGILLAQIVVSFYVLKLRWSLSSCCVIRIPWITVPVCVCEFVCAGVVVFGAAAHPENEQHAQTRCIRPKYSAARIFRHAQLFPLNQHKKDSTNLA